MILFRENCVVKRLDTYLQHLDIFKKRRKEMLYKKWVENVAQPLQRRITEKVTLDRGVKKTKQENFDYYLKQTSKTVTVPPFAGPLFRRQQEADKEKRSGPQNGTGRRYAIKELKETEKTSLCAKLPPFPFPVRSRPPGERRKTSPRSMRPGTHSACSPENFTCAVKKHLSGEEMTSDPSRIVFERQFWSSRLSRENPGAAKKVLRFQQQRPRSWAAGDHRQRRGPVERKPTGTRAPGATPMEVTHSSHWRNRAPGT
ncbi:protein FAM228A-like isoform 3-T6 [Erethizon dorsatum]